MVAGHYGVSFFAGARKSALPLWALFLAVQWLDLVWALFVLLRIEKARIVPGITAVNPIDFYYMPYTHSLPAVIFWSLAAAFIAHRFTTGRQRWSDALIIGTAVFSHWFLDFLVHRPVLGLLGDRFKIGLGLYNVPALALGLEVALLCGGLYIYLRSKPPGRIDRLGAIILGLAIMAILVFVSFGRPPRPMNASAGSALGAYLLLAAAAYWIERKKA